MAAPPRAAACAVISTSVVNTEVPPAPEWFTITATDASTVEVTTPNAGTPLPDSRLNRAGSSPSCAAATGISAQIIVQPFSAPSPETITATAMRFPAQLPPKIATSRRTPGTLPNRATYSPRGTGTTTAVPVPGPNPPLKSGEWR